MYIRDKRVQRREEKRRRSVRKRILKDDDINMKRKKRYNRITEIITTDETKKGKRMGDEVKE